MTDTTSDFFDSPREHSKVKAQIVSKYVISWARIMSDHLRKRNPEPSVAYVDLFSGPGLYSDGTPSTPILILKSAAEDPKLKTALRSFFSDENVASIEMLKDAVHELPTSANLKFQPVFESQKADVESLKALAVPAKIPVLYFLDQFGYKHVTVSMIKGLLAAGQSECIFFFNYKRVIAAIANPVMSSNVQGLFGSANRVLALKAALESAHSAVQRENVVLEHLILALEKAGAKHVLPFAFKVEDRHRSTHHLIFVTCHDKGYGLMKDIMAREGTPTSDGVPGLSFVQRQIPESLDLFPVDPISELCGEILRKFRGRTLSIEELFFSHSRGTNFLLSHYQEACLRLESDSLVSASPCAKDRPTIKGLRTMGKATRITFQGGVR